MEDEANRPANPHLAPSGTYQPTAPRRARRIRGMRRAEQVISGLPPGPAANATRGPPRRAERRPPPSPRRAVHLGPKDTERNAIRRRYARAPAAHRDEHLDEPTERASRIHTGQRAERHAVTYAPSGSLDRTTRSHAPSSRPSRRHRAAAPHDVFHRRTAEGARTTSSFRSSPPSGGRCQPPREFRRLAPSATSQQTAPRQAQRFADHRAEQNADHHRGPPPNSTSGPEDTERSAIRRRYARAPAVLRDPPRRTPRRAHRAYRPQNPRDQPGGGHSLTTTFAVGTPVTRRPPHRSGQARLRHPAPPLGVALSSTNGESLVRPYVAEPQELRLV